MTRVFAFAFLGRTCGPRRLLNRRRALSSDGLFFVVTFRSQWRSFFVVSSVVVE